MIGYCLYRRKTPQALHSSRKGLAKALDQEGRQPLRGYGMSRLSITLIRKHYQPGYVMTFDASIDYPRAFAGNSRLRSIPISGHVSMEWNTAQQRSVTAPSQSFLKHFHSFSLPLMRIADATPSTLYIVYRL